MNFLKADLIRILYVCSQPDTELFFFSRDVYDLEHTTSPIEAFQRLYKTFYQIIIVEMILFGDDLHKAISEIKRRFPSMIVVVIEDARFSNIEILNMGADSILPYGVTANAWHYMIHSQLKQQRQNIALNSRNKKLNIVSQLSRELYFTSSARHLIQQTINSLCASLDLYGVTIVLDVDEHQLLYAGNHQSQQMYETIIHLENYHPFQRTMQLGICQVYDNIQNDSYYQPIPILSDVKSTIIVPLRYKNTLLGVMGIFCHSRMRFTNDDLIIYEIFASHFTTALTQVRNHSIQQNDFEFNQQLLQGWHKLSAANSLEELADLLIESCQSSIGVKSALVWFYNHPEATHPHVVRATNNEIGSIFQKLEETQVMSELRQELDDKYYLPLRRHQEPGRLIVSLLDAMGQNEFMFFRIVKVGTFGGGLILASIPNKNFRVDEVNLIQRICQIVAQKYEHIILLDESISKSARLEALLRNVSEGIFFVNATNQVIFCNTQFTEITGINRSEIIDQDYRVLFDILVQKSPQPAVLSEAILRAIAELNQANSEEESYSIVELMINKQALYLEFSLLTAGEGSVGWGGVIRQRQVLTNINSLVDFTINGLVLQHLSPMLQQVKRHTKDMLKLATHPNLVQPLQWIKRLQELDQESQAILQIWSDLSELNKHSAVQKENAGIEIHTLIQQLMLNESFKSKQVQLFSLDNAARFCLFPAKLGAALQNIVLFVISDASVQSSIKLSWDAQDNQMIFLLEDFQASANLRRLQHLYQGVYEHIASLIIQDRILFSVYLSVCVVLQYHGIITIEDDAAGASDLIIMLPGLLMNEKTLAQSQAPLSNNPPIPFQPLHTVLFIEGISVIGPKLYQTLQTSNLEILKYRVPHQAFEDLKLMRPNLIMIDTRQTTKDISFFIEQLRGVTASPIILFADKASSAEKMKYLKSGVEEYITGDMPMDEMLTRINIISNRQAISDRVREPLELRYLKIDFTQRQVFLKGKPLVVTPTEYNLLRILANNIGHVITHADLLKEVWGPEYQAEKQYLWVNLSRLRKKLEPDVDGPRYIHNESGIGYIFIEILSEDTVSSEAITQKLKNLPKDQS